MAGKSSSTKIFLASDPVGSSSERTRARPKLKQVNNDERSFLSLPSLLAWVGSAVAYLSKTSARVTFAIGPLAIAADNQNTERICNILRTNISCVRLRACEREREAICPLRGARSDLPPQGANGKHRASYSSYDTAKTTSHRRSTLSFPRALFDSLIDSLFDDALACVACCRSLDEVTEHRAATRLRALLQCASSLHLQPCLSPRSEAERIWRRK